MAMTQLALIFVGALAVILSGAGLFGPFADDATNVVMAFAGAITWGIFGISAFDVIVLSSAFASQSEPILPLAYLGLGMSLVVGIFAFWALIRLARGETDTTTEQSMMP